MSEGRRIWKDGMSLWNGRSYEDIGEQHPCTLSLNEKLNLIRNPLFHLPPPAPEFEKTKKTKKKRVGHDPSFAKNDHIFLKKLRKEKKREEKRSPWPWGLVMARCTPENPNVPRSRALSRNAVASHDHSGLRSM